jgi:hypothetical protein
MKKKKIKSQKTMMIILILKLTRGYFMLKPIVILLLFSTSSFSYAWVCPNNFNQIAAGDSIEKVTTVCGKPASEKKSQAGYRGPQQWQYYVTVNQPLSGSGAPAGATPTVQMSIAFVNQKAINITVQAQSVASTSICGPTISIGDSDDSIKKNCGSPTFIQKQDTGNGTNEKTIEIIEYKYNTSAPNTLTFENGVLKSRK